LFLPVSLSVYALRIFKKTVVSVFALLMSLYFWQVETIAWEMLQAWVIYLPVATVKFLKFRKKC
jgi:hypothetical protein